MSDVFVHVNSGLLIGSWWYRLCSGNVVVFLFIPVFLAEERSVRVGYKRSMGILGMRSWHWGLEIIDKNGVIWKVVWKGHWCIQSIVRINWNLSLSSTGEMCLHSGCLNAAIFSCYKYTGKHQPKITSLCHVRSTWLFPALSWNSLECDQQFNLVLHFPPLPLTSKPGGLFPFGHFCQHWICGALPEVSRCRADGLCEVTLQCLPARRSSLTARLEMLPNSMDWSISGPGNCEWLLAGRFHISKAKHFIRRINTAKKL